VPPIGTTIDAGWKWLLLMDRDVPTDVLQINVHAIEAVLIATLTLLHQPYY
jgi:hypothetical protein